ncbi:SmdA family multidrug ABC transporter permease/ATP-binding protein [Yersinia ruckeri]|uniref:SmdA family multidrug ABC transporter permease/ATP-binding protein n=1 Tax=Yersinia ruckeri TaxID=29486 RepID=UPI0011A7FEFE|nr:SmdA family multidrug ABC transporter permease/ATP-binding protein [Yersinia ruckeri]EKN3345517.1 SmdA family multidrug ABC transporter permease/ATP-binding protein [Yersinia ruckeri]EKN3361939.1 SmdA family multidrug ABC transporter permease/ATP-binding protein [Yersinia ruckeri]EKN4201463.1 SmdA family multidrug ABC transporter permease/ATP-binding protein [Yersinia ruckeri]EKN4208336.1 SmdA family multidrug ABC transporter permease/ATP-binding protein [Yersinia ruckeri]EKN4698650.1 SmdA 
MRLFAQLGWYFRREWRRYLGAVVLLMIIAILQLLPPKLVGVIVDGMTAKSLSTKMLLVWIGVMVITAVVVYLLRYVWRILLFGASYQLAVELRSNFYRQLSRQTPGFYLRHRTGDLMARATNDVDRVVFAAGEGVLTLVDSLVMGCAVLIVMSTQISWQLTLLSLLPMPVMAIVIKYFGEQLHQRFKSAQGAFSALNNQAQDSLSSIRMIKAFGLEDHQSEQFSRVAAEAGAKNMHVAKVDARFDPTIYIAIGLANLLAIGGGSWMVVNGSITLGQLTSFVMYLGLMIWPMLALAWMFNIVERGSAAYGRIRSLLQEAPEVVDGKIPLQAERSILTINIRRFVYPGSDKPVLQDIKLKLVPGEMLGLCGPTGSGKSTLLALIQRQFDIDDGEICYQGRPLTDIRLDDWRRRLSVVSQTPFLFSDSVAGNIALGKPGATPEEIEQVARLASVHEDILRLPQGYATEVGERGVMLSGGQKQRISIARALLLDSEILILDDALSAVDGQTEYEILSNLRRWGTNRTVIISAHRLSALTEAGEIIVMQHGGVAQRGDHELLLNQSGWYREMYRYQQIEAALDSDDGQEAISHE